MIRHVKYLIEGMLTALVYLLLRLMPLVAASACGGWIARTIGPRTRVHQIAVQNMQVVLPEMTGEQRRQALIGMWDNLGRVFAEYPHLNSSAMARRISVIGTQHLEQAKTHDGPVMFISGHLGNWELLARAAQLYDMPMHLLYRAANNPMADYIVARMRKPFCLGLHAKGRAGARAALMAMRRREPLAMLIDQKANDGIESMFMGHVAMTSPAAAELMMRFQPMVVPAFCRRISGVNFEIEVLAPLAYEVSEATSVQQLTDRLNALIAERICQDPKQWFWVHKRWPFSRRPFSRHSVDARLSGQ